MKQKKRIIKRIYYPSGLISLIFLPIMCLWFINENESFKEYRIISATFPTKNKSLHFAFEPTEITSIRDFTYFTLTGDNNEDLQKLKQAQAKISELIRSQDTTIGVCFKFNHQAKFWTYIKAIEICKTEKAKLFVPDENAIWIYNLTPKKVKDERIYGCSILSTIDSIALASYHQEQKDIKRQELIKETKGLIKKYYISILLFLLMIILTIKRMAKNRINAK